MIDWSKVARMHRVSASITGLLLIVLTATLGWVAWESNALLMYVATVFTAWSGIRLVQSELLGAKLAEEAGEAWEQMERSKK